LLFKGAGVDSFSAVREIEGAHPTMARLLQQTPLALYLYSEAYMLAIRLPRTIEKRLDKLARRTGRTKTFHARQAILEHLEDLEDLYLAERALRHIRNGKERTIPLKSVLKRHSLPP
jgi:RHH-type rel operon transcriptional repressor/antitoxin RelB